MNRRRIPARTHCAALFLGALWCGFAGPLPADAQEVVRYRISQRATVSQHLGATVVSLDYSRPLVRNRSDIFGKVVHWGELWTPGANEASVLEVSDTVQLNGATVPPGRWSMWVIPSQVGPWELVLDARDSLFHTQRPKLNDDQIRFVVETREGTTFHEALAWSFPRIAQDGATLLMNWGTLEIPLEVQVRSVEPESRVAAEEGAQYVGEWQVTFQPNPEPGGEGTPPPTVLRVRYSDEGMLFASFPPGTFMPPAPDSAALAAQIAAEASMTPQERERSQARRTLAVLDGGEFEYLLVPRARGVFLLGWIDDGVLLDVEPYFHEFEFEDGRAVRLVLRDDEDRVWGRATRVR